MEVYDSKRVAIAFALLPIDAGYAEEEFFTWEMVEADYVSKRGADGRVVRIATNNKLVKATIKLQHTSPGNTTLSTINQLDIAAPNGAGIGPLSVVDTNGLALLVCGEAWITGPPKQARGKTLAELEWELEGIVTIRFDGGNV